MKGEANVNIKHAIVFKKYNSQNYFKAQKKKENYYDVLFGNTRKIMY